MPPSLAGRSHLGRHRRLADCFQLKLLNRPQILVRALVGDVSVREGECSGLLLRAGRLMDYAVPCFYK